VPVLIDDGSPPTISCGFGGGSAQLLLSSTRASVLEHAKFKYGATDGCGGDLDVSVAVFSNEIEDFHNQELALLFQNGLANDAVNLYIAKGVCSTDSNGQCIKNPVLPDNRVYTVIVTATDLAGLTASTKCAIVINPKNVASVAPSNLADSTQRFFLTSYSSTFTRTLPN
jgi:hypothetical protein